MGTQVLVTGATGFVAGHVITELLEHGYAVRATVRDLAATAKRAHLVEAAARIGGELEFVAADLDRDSGWAAAVAGCATVLHVASPFPAAPPEDEQELITTAVDGTLRVLRAAAASGTVRRVVLTSSIAAIAHGHADHGVVRTEADWSIVAKCASYQKSKTLAERAAWDFAAALPADQRFDLVVVNPGMVLGPVQSANTSTSHEPVRRLLSGAVPGAPRVGWSVVDVRDLAVLHRLAMEVPEAAGNRYVAAGEHVWMRDMGRMLAAEFGPRGYRVPTRALPDLLVRAVAVFDKGVRLTLPTLGVAELLSSEKARRELGWTMRPPRESVLDTAESLIQHGIVGGPRRAARPVAATA
ncbi:SDR family oxidoreductase [Nocardia goodfellowii]|uniref:Nucleoside-diphosphate-sugar epimerase n=1 Tax=Nocardia goodfellowii TaxID=882446 RepID=A0ABS4QAM5_9NOCA|nr:aldehyde reductase [Nocardia goodfellowii]MBP2188712.1 nucleoside-diphosphate-sugar epimerase [Nocardia goodfellowii]